MPCRPAISSMSLGRCYAGHSIEHKLSMAAKHGIEGIELFYEDLADLATSRYSSDLYAAARYVRSLCTSLNIEILCLQPFMHYEGLRDRQRHAERIDEIKVWMDVVKILDTDVIAVPSSFLPKEEISGDMNLIVSDLRELADLGLQQTPVIRFAYESLSWGTYINKWEQSWEIVQRVDRENFGLCLDTFNILGRIYADPESPTFCTPNADQDVAESVQRLLAKSGPPKDKIFFMQIVDAEKLSSPLLPGHPFYKPEQPSRMSWSRNCRLFYGESDKGAYLPVKDVAEAIINGIGYDGWVSNELFNRAMERTDEGVVEELAERSKVGWHKLVADLGLKIERPQPTIQRKDSGQDIAHHDSRL
ncbi:3-dehydroshikimate dehydratase [Aaosphaeria arxii CBS 175.79]|uniref:3-dehydroshikimate dehydratase n=1 Tax=Aaosphaeria arxii CBS 175.79 TaxID=1450172 RepID=A0A6A5Y2F3_9PLEO|nr:3-dehydroshikimate dehydratase [Aaosphaeria arxii CBS 175.79]KAF2019745.1 3-dehydroshikimate dehydratase [Aaosphaeria arxii CBS 175.79]